MPIHNRLLLGATAAAALWMPHAFAQNLSEQDRQFIQEAAKGGMREVHMGRLGLERGMSLEVKGLSQRLVNDHDNGNKELAALAKQKGVTLPGDDAQMVNSMPIANTSGADFDKEFARIMVEDHEKDIAAFEKEASSGSDPAIKNWASKTLPTLRAHLDEAKALPK